VLGAEVAVSGIQTGPRPTRYPGAGDAGEMVPLNFNLVGKAYQPVEATVIAEQVQKYAAASGDGNPRYAPGPGQVVPPVFPAVLAYPLLAMVASDPELGIDNPLMIVHGEHEFSYHRPLAIGAPLVLAPSLDRVEDKGRSAVFVVRVAASGTDGRAFVDQYATIFVRGGGSGSVIPAREGVEAPSKGRRVVTFVREVESGMPVRYAEASGDHNPIHLDEAIARAAGLPGVINHGLGTLSVVAAGLTDHLAGGDPGRLRRLKARFVEVVLPGCDLATSVWESNGPTLVFETSRPDGAVVMSGMVEVMAA
jgi:acyl dehydratase